MLDVDELFAELSDDFVNRLEVAVEIEYELDELATHVESGAWEKVAQCQVLARILNAVGDYMNSLEVNEKIEALKKQSLFVVLLFDLESYIQKISKQANIALKESSKLQLQSTTQDFTKMLKE